MRWESSFIVKVSEGLTVLQICHSQERDGDLLDVAAEIVFGDIRRYSSVNSVLALECAGNH